MYFVFQREFTHFINGSHSTVNRIKTELMFRTNVIYFTALKHRAAKIHSSDFKGIKSFPKRVISVLRIMQKTRALPVSKISRNGISMSRNDDYVTLQYARYAKSIHHRRCVNHSRRAKCYSSLKLTLPFFLQAMKRFPLVPYLPPSHRAK